MKIIGAGMAGLLAANMLRRHHPVVYERKEGLPFNHSAVLRFRNEAISRATGIPFKKVTVHKAMVSVDGECLVDRIDLRLSNMYAQKVSGAVITRSIMNLEPVERFIAPGNFIEQMASSLNIEFNTDGRFGINTIGEEGNHEPTISTIPMPILMDAVAWHPKPEFSTNPIWTVVAKIEEPRVDVYQTLYFPAHSMPIYRASLTGSQLIMEFIRDPGCEGIHDQIMLVARVLENFGIRHAVVGEVEIKKQHLGKIAPVDELSRKNFIFTMSDKHHIYSLGRFATWRQILLDDLVQDIQFIEDFITQRDLYAVQKSIIR